jgi:hypothetical protein
MFTAYLDESADADEGRVYSIGGYFGREREWVKFEPLWEKVLRDFGVSHFHATDWENLWGEFKGWEQETKIEFIQQLIAVIHSVQIYGFHSAVALREFRSVFPRERADAPYFICFQSCVGEIAVGCGKEKEQVAFVFEEKKEVEFRAIRLYNHIIERVDWPGRKWLGSITFAGKKKVLPLQAADFLAYEGFKHLDNLVQKSGRPIRKTLDLLHSEERLYGKLWDRERLEELKREYIDADEKGLIRRVPIGKGEAR